MIVENFIKDYLRNKKTYNLNLDDCIKKVERSINTHNYAFPVEIKDLVLSSGQNLPIEKNNHISDQTTKTFLRYEKLKEEYSHVQNKLLNEKLDYLDYLTDLKSLFQTIDFLTIKLQPKQKISIDIFTDGGKMSEIAKVLNCSYNTARSFLQAGIDHIRDGLDEELVESISYYDPWKMTVQD